MICSYGQNKAGEARIFELTPEREIVWEYVNDAIRAHNVHIVTTNGEPVEGKPMR